MMIERNVQGVLWPGRLVLLLSGQMPLQRHRNHVADLLVRVEAVPPQTSPEFGIKIGRDLHALDRLGSGHLGADGVHSALVVHLRLQLLGLLGRLVDRYIGILVYRYPVLGRFGSSLPIWLVIRLRKSSLFITNAIISAVHGGLKALSKSR